MNEAPVKGAPAELALPLYEGMFDPAREALRTMRSPERVRELALKLCDTAGSAIWRERRRMLRMLLQVQAAQCGVERLCLFTGTPRTPGGFTASPWVVSAKWSVTPGKEIEPADAYSDLLVDPGYMEIMRGMLSDGHYYARPGDLPSPMLRGFYQNEFVSDSLILPIGAEGAHYVYFSAALYHGKFTAEQRLGLLACSRLASNVLQPAG